MPRILVAEDDDDLRALIATTLRTDGHDVTEARDGRDAVDALSRALFPEQGDEPPDLVITDVRMPGVNGLSLVAGIRAYGWRTRTIVITAYDLGRVRSEADHLGADAVLGKPLDIDDLRTAVVHVLTRKKSGPRALRLKHDVS